MFTVKIKSEETDIVRGGVMMKEIFSRTSVRKFKDIKVEPNKIEKLLRAAMAAPSAGNQQPWEFLVIENKETLATLADMSPYSKFLKDAPLAIIVLANKEKLVYPECWQQDLGAATQNMLLEAVHLDLGAVWLGVAPIVDRMEYVRKLFQLEDKFDVYAVVPFGYPDQKTEASDRYDSSKVHFEKM